MKSIKINGKDYCVNSEITVLNFAKEQGIDIPSFCYHRDVKTKNHCGLCTVIINGKIEYACSVYLENGMDIITDSEELFNIRKSNLEKIINSHLLECDDCVWFQNCKLLSLAKKFDLNLVSKRNDQDEIFQVDSIVFDQTKCIGCGNCIDVCPTGFLKLNERGKIKLSEDVDCINCGQCILHCPAGTIEGVGEFESLENILKDKNRITVAQFAPAIRTSIEEGSIATNKLVAALKEVGFDYVFDTAVGADFTTMEESDELIERLNSKTRLPALTSCCPAWVKFVEENYPQFIPNLCSVKSPQIILGEIVKKCWNKDAFVVSIMPCIAKKSEIKREELKGAVDMVLTTRELLRLFKKQKIDLEKIKGKETDSFLGLASGAGVIYGSSGGVFESALRTAHFKITGREINIEDIKDIRGMDGIKEKEIKVGNHLIRVCVVSGIDNAIKVLENSSRYDAIEVMACPGGCVGGGGQPLPSNKSIIKKRSEGLYSIDNNKDVRGAHNNPIIKEIYSKIKNPKEIFHTTYNKRGKSSIYKLKNSRETI